MNKYDLLYNELIKISESISPYYDVDKIKPYSVYIWSKDKNSKNVFDILEEGIVFYVEDHRILDKAKPIIKRIQLKLKEIRLCVE